MELISITSINSVHINWMNSTLCVPIYCKEYSSVKQTGKQADKQIGRLTDKQTDSEACRQVVSQTGIGIQTGSKAS